MATGKKIDFHTHSVYSNDAFTSMSQLSWFFKRFPDVVLAITDHDEIRGALAAKEAFGERIIVGEEIKTKQGEIIGLFLNNYIKPGIDVEETIDVVHRQGGLVMVPHPFKQHGKSDSPLLREMLFKLHNQFDLIEIFNARNRTPGANESAIAYAEKYNKAQVVGSDAHAIYELGRTYVHIPVYRGNEKLIEDLQQGKHICHSIHLLHRILTRMQRELKERRILLGNDPHS